MTIKSARLLYLKGMLFVLAGVLAAAAILIECGSWKVAGLLVLVVWCFARAYYFAFYVIQQYVDPGFRFSGLGAFVRYVISRPRRLP